MAERPVRRTEDGAPAQPISRDKFFQLLRELDAALEGRPHTELLIVGGAAVMQVVYERMSFDVDVAEPALDSAILTAAREIGRRHDLEAGWLNDAFHHALHAGGKPAIRLRSVPLYQGTNLSVVVPSTDQLMWLKVQAGREIDFDDVAAMMTVEAPDRPVEEWIDRISATFGRPLANEQLTLVMAAATEARRRHLAQHQLPPNPTTGSQGLQD